MSPAAVEEARLLHQAMISDNYEKMREQRRWTAFVVLRHRSVRLPGVIAISLVSVERTDRLTDCGGRNHGSGAGLVTFARDTWCLI